MKNYIFVLALLCFVACNNRDTISEQKQAIRDTTLNPTTPTPTTKANIEADNTKKFIRTADIKFSVKSVVNSTYNIENICNANGGYVAYTNLESNITNTTIQPISNDSTLTSSNYTVTNNIVLRVPNAKLDTTLHAIAENIDYLDYRIIKADDVSIQLYANTLTQKRTLYNKTLHTNKLLSSSKKLNETMAVEDAIDANQTIADNAQLDNLQLADKVTYSMVTINIYQTPTIKTVVTATPTSISIFVPSLGSRLLNSVQFGWSIFTAILVALTKFWSLLLLLVIGLCALKWYNKKPTII